MKQSVYTIISMVSSLFISVSSIAQSKDAATNKRIIEEKNYIFKAQTATPSHGKVRTLTSEYDLTVSGDSVVAYLPYFGRAYTAPLNSSEGGIKFTSVKPGYSTTVKKGRWLITIKPKDISDVEQLYLDISESGYGTLRVISINRQPISFSGYIVEGKERKKKAF